MPTKSTPEKKPKETPKVAKSEKVTKTPKAVKESKEPKEVVFADLTLDPRILKVLADNAFTTPTPIQAASIPLALEGTDIIGVAQTGTGKTLAFALPSIQKLMSSEYGAVLVLLPTRELAVQVEETFRKVGRPLGMKTAVLIGGLSIHKQIRDLEQYPNVIIGTPGRIIDHLQQGSLSLRDVEILVLDEADRMLDMGFAPQINTILESVPKQRQTLLFSATMPPEIVQIAAKYMKSPTRIEVAVQGTASKNVEQQLYVLRANQKMHLLDIVLKEYQGTVLIFCRTKFGAKKIAQVLNRNGHSADEIHSNRSFNQRQAALKGFKAGSPRILVATDIASRGIDVKGIELVLNYDIPEQAEDYIHRIGRTGRASHSGHAITFATPEQTGKIRQIERLMNMPIAVAKLPELPKESPQDQSERSRAPRSVGYGQRSGGGQGRSFPQRRYR